MIRWLSKDEWKDYIENRAELGTYVSHSLFNAGSIEPAVDKYNFSSAIIKVTFIENESNEKIDLFFDNSGPVKFGNDEYELGNKAVEYNFLYYQPYMVHEIMQFVEMMSEKFGARYREPRTLHAINEIELVNEEYKQLLTEIHEQSMFFSNIRTNASGVISPELLNAKPHELGKYASKFLKPTMNFKYFSVFNPDTRKPYPIDGKNNIPQYSKLDELIDFTIHSSITDLMEEKEYMEDYKYYQQGLIYFIASLEPKYRDKILSIDEQSENS